MAKGDASPAVGVVAVATAAGVMVARRAMTSRAVGHALMRYPDLFPSGGEVATAAVAGVMVVWSFLFVAGVAIGLACVIEGDILPGDFLMAAAALPVIMIGGQ